MKIKPRFDECGDCRLHQPNRISGTCLRCGAGEFFEPTIEANELSNDQAMRLYGEMIHDDEE